MKRREARDPTYRMVDFGVIGMLLLQLFVMLLLLLPVLLTEGLQVLAALVFLHHLVLLELLVPLFVEVLQILRGLRRSVYRLSFIVFAGTVSVVSREKPQETPIDGLLLRDAFLTLGE